MLQAVHAVLAVLLHLRGEGELGRTPPAPCPLPVCTTHGSRAAVGRATESRTCSAQERQICRDEVDGRLPKARGGDAGRRGRRTGPRGGS